jgi:hypothetical protein
MIDAFPSPKPREDVVFLPLPVRRNESADGPPDDFTGGVAEQALSGCVERLDNAFEILGDDRVVRRLHDRGQVRLSRARRADVFLR